MIWDCFPHSRKKRRPRVLVSQRETEAMTKKETEIVQDFLRGAIKIANRVQVKDGVEKEMMGFGTDLLKSYLAMPGGIEAAVREGRKD